MALLEMQNIVKKFGDFTANDHINLSVEKGEIMALLGENGAGKTTLMNILYGLYSPTAGTIKINGKEVKIADPHVAIANGIGMVHQHFMLVEPFTVAENIVLGMEIAGPLGVLNSKEAIKKVEELSKNYGLEVDPHQKIQDISVGMQQRVEILKALYRGADILILDEPTAVLTPQEIDDLIKIMNNLIDDGKTIIIITHKLKEIKIVADRCTVIRRGKMIDTVKVANVSEEDLASMMVGRNVKLTVDKNPAQTGDQVFSVNDLVVKDNRDLNAVNGCTFSLRRGEILGIAGVDGNGQKELIEAIMGVRPITSGTVLTREHDLTNVSPRKVFETGISAIPEDRQVRGLVLDFTLAENFILENYYKEPFSKNGLLNLKYMKEHAQKLIDEFDVRPPDPSYLAADLSGGNQQKAIIARQVTHDPQVLIAVQPTRGLDVGAIEYVHKAMISQRDKGKAVLMVSLDLDEVLEVSDRIVVIYDGKIVGEFDAEDADERKLGVLMAGGSLE